VPDDSGTTDASRPRGRRLLAGGLLALTIVAGLAVHSFAPDSAASDIAGDALYAVAAYLAVVLVVPHLRVPAVALIAAVWCTFVELFQLTGIPLALGAAFSPVMLVLGTVFDARDLVVYLVTIVAVAGIDGAIRAGRRVRS
jgi:predicted Kef-type K+ transport protein